MPNQYGEPWTPDREAMLRKLWAEGLTASQIAKRLGGCTRNAVIGKANRLRRKGAGVRSIPEPERVRRWLAAMPKTRAPRWRPQPKPKPPRIIPQDPAAQVAAALLGAAAKAERRCGQFRSHYSREYGRAV